ncbi:MAG TPA: deoxyribose-phosphate aldolase [Bacteroidales bacterium]|nr:deoxyribose-phosphate aldolase [Bacteroidales bacterium]HRZ50005.1 deoxyribose-phosphate aldolase [Bacteroidales bacterium]
MDIEKRIREAVESRKEIKDLQEVYGQIFGMLDLTTLEGTDRTGTIEALCGQALEWKKQLNGKHHPAAVCVYPVFAQTVAKALKGSGIRTACVAGAFPSGQSPLEVRVHELELALEGGANEIDMVISRGRMLAGDETFIGEEVAVFSQKCRGRALLKVILETGELKDGGLICRASRIAMEAGADFLKTSTGKIQPGATPEAFFLMLEEVRQYHRQSGRVVGIKAAGGIASSDDALIYYLLTRQVLGEEWLVPERLRFGASRLASALMDLLIRP